MKRLPIAIFVALFLAIAAQVGGFILSSSNTYDEAAVLGAGVSYVKTGRLDLEHKVHPPLHKYLMGFFVNLASPSFDAGSPEIARDRFYEFGHTFLFHNTVSPEKILALARLPALLLGLVMAACVLLWAQRWFGIWGAVVALAAYAFEPSLIAHSGLATMDVGVSCFMFLAAFSLVVYLEEERVRFLILSGIFAGCAAMTKIPGVFFFVWAAFLLAAHWNRRARLPTVGFIVSRGLLLALLAGIVVLAVYQIRHVDLLIELVRSMFRVIFQKDPIQNYPNFLHGHVKVGGWPHYYLVALAVKCTVPFLLLWLASLFALPPDKMRVLVAPILSFIFICTFAEKQNGLRYLLPVFPFVCVLIGGLAGAAARSRKWAGLLALLLAWHAGETVALYSNQLTYFNEFAGGPRKGFRWLVDCNLDWGQDFRAIKKYLTEQGSPEIIVACLGNGDRQYYFGARQDLLVAPDYPDARFDHVNSENPARELLIVSASFLQGFGLSDPTLFAWLRDKKPAAQIANSTFVYDVTSDAQSQFAMGRIYKRNRLSRLALRQFRRAHALRPKDPIPFVAMADVYSEDHSPAEAAVFLKQAAALGWKR